MTTTLKSYTPTRKPRPPAEKALPEVEPLTSNTSEGNGLGVEEVLIEAVSPLPSVEPTSEPFAVEDSIDSDFQPRMLTLEEVANWLSVNPGTKKFFVNKKGELVRKWIEEYDWMTRPGGGIIKIPTWFGPEVMNPKTGIISPYEPATQGSADRI